MDVKATFSHDLEDNYISKHLVDQLDLKWTPDPIGKKKYCPLGLKTVQLLGTAQLQWALQGCNKSRLTKCSVVADKPFNLCFKYSLLQTTNPPP